MTSSARHGLQRPGDPPPAFPGRMIPVFQGLFSIFINEISCLVTKSATEHPGLP